MPHLSLRRLFPMLLVSLLLTPLVADAQGTAFTYQGKLSDGGAPANGSYDFQFSLYDTAALGTGTQFGTAQTLASVAVSGGVFTVQLDFGACPACFNGAPRYLEIAVKPTSSGTFTTLGPRQPLNSTPYAIRSLNAAAADGLSVACVNCVTSSQIGSVSGGAVTGTIPVASVPPGSANYIQNMTSQQAASNFNISGNGVIGGTLGIGTSAPPAGLLHARGVNPVRILGDTTTLSGSEAVDFFAWSSIYGTDLGGMRIQRQSSSGNIDTLLFAAVSGNSAAEVMRVSGNGKVGIGTTNPIAILHVNAGNDVGVEGFSSGNTGVYGLSASSSGMGVYGIGNFIGVRGESVGGYGVYGYSSSGYAGYFDGSVHVNGKVGIGTTSPSTKLEVDGGSNDAVLGVSTNGVGVYGTSSSLYGVRGVSNTSTGVFGTSSSGYGVFGQSNTNYAGFFNGSVNVTGSLTVGTLGSAGITSLCRNASNQIASCSSSLRYKTDVHPFAGGLDTLNRLRPITFNWKQGGQRDLGLAAEEVEKIEPLLVTYNDKGEVEGVKYDRINVLLINAVNQQQAQIKAQQQENKRLQSQVEALRKLVCLDHPGAAVCR